MEDLVTTVTAVQPMPDMADRFMRATVGLVMTATEVLLMLATVVRATPDMAAHCMQDMADHFTPDTVGSVTTVTVALRMPDTAARVTQDMEDPATISRTIGMASRNAQKPVSFAPPLSKFSRPRMSMKCSSRS
jgi:hypothetical protein